MIIDDNAIRMYLEMQPKVHLELFNRSAAEASLEWAENKTGMSDKEKDELLLSELRSLRDQYLEEHYL